MQRLLIGREAQALGQQRITQGLQVSAKPGKALAKAWFMNLTITPKRHGPPSS
jgi:hypothetical protein